MKLILQKRGNRLMALDAPSIDAIAKIKEGAWVTCEVKTSRSIAALRMYFALLKIVHDTMPEGEQFLTVDDLHEAVKVYAGIGREIKMGNKTIWIPGSISFDKMRDTEKWNAFFDKIIGLVIERWLPNQTNAGLRAEVCDMIGISDVG